MDWNEAKALKVGDLVRYAIPEKVETIEIVTEEAEAQIERFGGVVLVSTLVVIFDHPDEKCKVGDEGGISEANSHLFEKIA